MGNEDSNEAAPREPARKKKKAKKRKDTSKPVKVAKKIKRPERLTFHEWNEKRDPASFIDDDISLALTGARPGDTIVCDKTELFIESGFIHPVGQCLAAVGASSALSAYWGVSLEDAHQRIQNKVLLPPGGACFPDRDAVLKLLVDALPAVLAGIIVDYAWESDNYFISDTRIRSGQSGTLRFAHCFVTIMNIGNLATPQNRVYAELQHLAAERTVISLADLNSLGIKGSGKRYVSFDISYHTFRVARFATRITVPFTGIVMDNRIVSSTRGGAYKVDKLKAGRSVLDKCPMPPVPSSFRETLIGIDGGEACTAASLVHELSTPKLDPAVLFAWMETAYFEATRRQATSKHLVITELAGVPTPVVCAMLQSAIRTRPDSIALSDGQEVDVFMFAMAAVCVLANRPATNDTKLHRSVPGLAMALRAIVAAAQCSAVVWNADNSTTWIAGFAFTLIRYPAWNFPAAYIHHVLAYVCRLINTPYTLTVDPKSTTRKIHTFRARTGAPGVRELSTLSWLCRRIGAPQVPDDTIDAIRKGELTLHRPTHIQRIPYVYVHQLLDVRSDPALLYLAGDSINTTKLCDRIKELTQIRSEPLEYAHLSYAVGHIATVFFEALIRTERGRDEIILANNTTGVRKNTTAFQLSTDEREARATEVRALKYRVLEEYPIPIGDEVTFDQKADDWLVDGHPWDQHRQTIVQKWRIPVLDWPFARAALDWSMDRILSRVVRISRVCGTKKTIKRARDAIKRDEKLRYRRDCQVGQPLVDPSDDDSEDDESKTRTQLAKEAERAKKREHRKQQTREKRREQREQEEKENSKGIMGIVENLGMWIRELTQRYTVRTLIQARAWMATQWESMNVPEIDLDGASLAQSNIHMSDIRVFQFMAHLSLYAPGVFVLVHSPLSFAIRKPMMFREIEAHVLAQLSDRLRRPTEEKRTLDQREEKKRETLDQREEKKRETLDQREEKKREALGQRDEEKRETLDGKKRETLDQCDEKTAPKRKRDEPGEEPEATAKRKREDDEPDKHHKATGKRKRGETDDEASERRDKKTNAERRREAPDKQGEKALKRKREDGAPDKHHKHHKVRRDGERGEAPKGGSKWLDNWPTPKYETDDAQRLRPHQLRLKHRLQEKIKRDPQQQGRIIYGEVRFGKMRSAADTIRMMIEELGDAFPRFVIYVVPDKCNVTHAERELRDVCCAPLWGKNIKVSTDTKHGTVHGKRGKTSFKSYHITIITREVFRTHADWLADNGHDIYYVIDEIDSVFTSSTRSEAALRVASTSAFFLGATATMRPTNDNKQIKWLRLLSPQFYVSTKNWKVALCSIDREYYDPGVTAKFVTHEVDEGHDGSFNLELVHANPTILQLAREIVDRRGDVLIWANSKKHLETLFTLLAKAGLKPGRLADILNRERNAILLNSYTDCRGLNGGERFAEAVEVPTASNAATRHQKIGRQIGPAQRSKEVTLHTVAVRGIMNRRLANHDRLDEDNMSVHHGLLFHDDSLPTLEPVAPGGL